MMPDLDHLPDDPAQLKELIVSLVKAIQERDTKNAQLTHQLERLLRYQFGKKSEKVVVEQLLMPFAGMPLPPHSEPTAPPKEERPRERSKEGHGRQHLPADLPREAVLHDVPEGERICKSCGGELTCIGEDHSEQLEYQPSSFRVLRHVRKKYACKPCQGSVVTAELPGQPIEKGLPGPGLLAHVVVSKYADHLPLHRQEGIYARHGVEIARSTMCDWVREVAKLLEPIVRQMKQRVLLSRYIRTDDTTVPVLDPIEAHARSGHAWVYIGDTEHRYTVFDYTPTRSGEGPLVFLGSYKGYLQADAFAGYNAVYRDLGAVEVGCWAHARRKFFEAQTTDELNAHAALAWIRRLYDIEDQARGTQPEERRRLREEHARPILADFKVWLEKVVPSVLPKGPTAGAIGYALDQWGALTRHIEDGVLEIDNNAAERALRAIAIGRKNWTFAGNDAAARRAAVLYSLVATCKDHEVDPFAYLRDVIDRVTTHPARDIAALLPDSWKAARDSAVPPTPAPAATR